MTACQTAKSAIVYHERCRRARSPRWRRCYRRGRGDAATKSVVSFFGGGDVTKLSYERSLIFKRVFTFYMTIPNDEPCLRVDRNK